jgi:hypothetical protein
MGNSDIPPFRTKRGKTVRITALRAAWPCALALRMAVHMRVNLNGVGDSNRKKTRCKPAGNA